jgi:hypothetical protein
LKHDVPERPEGAQNEGSIVKKTRKFLYYNELDVLPRAQHPQNELKKDAAVRFMSSIALL